MTEESFEQEDKSSTKQVPKKIPGRNGGFLCPQEKGGPPKNPKGRPKGAKSRSTIFKKWMEFVIHNKNPFNNKIEEMTVEDKMVLKMISNVLVKGDVAAFREAYDSVYGKHKERIDHTSAGEKIQVINAPQRLNFEDWEKTTKSK